MMSHLVATVGSFYVYSEKISLASDTVLIALTVGTIAMV